MVSMMFEHFVWVFKKDNKEKTILLKLFKILINSNTYPIKITFRQAAYSLYFVKSLLFTFRVKINKKLFLEDDAKIF